MFAEYVDSSGKSDGQQQNQTESSPVYQQSPSATASALHIHHSPFQNQTTPACSDQASPFGENSNSFPEPSPKRAETFGQKFTGPPPGAPYHRPYNEPGQFAQYPGFPGPYQNFSQPPPNFQGQFSDPSSSGIPPLMGYSGSGSRRRGDGDRKSRDRKGT